jgi:2-methylcitrate dehydratase PrpD
MSNCFGVGNSARIGIVSAGLAEHGFRSTLTAIDGLNGLRQTMSGSSPEQLNTALAGLGTHWNLPENSFKQFPTETISQAAVEGLLALRMREASRPGIGEVSRIHLETSPLVAEIIEERSARTIPIDVLTRTFDTKFCAASAWLTGTFSPATMTPSAELDREILQLRDRMTVAPEPRFGSESVRITVELASGEVFEETVEGYVGSWRRPMTDAFLEDKLLRSGNLSPTAHRGICDAVWALGSHGTVGDLITRLGPVGPLSSAAVA